VHEAFVDVTEEGTEAAAATGVTLAPARGFSAQPLVVKADRPFVWMVVERRSGTLLFAGVVRDPRG
jgi:serpin B